MRDKRTKNAAVLRQNNLVAKISEGNYSFSSFYENLWKKWFSLIKKKIFPLTRTEAIFKISFK